MDTDRIQAGNLRRHATAVAGIVIAGAIAAPALVYAVGSLLGPYEGPNGFLGFLSDVYGDAFTGNPAALGLLLSPAALLLSGWLIVLAWRRTPGTAGQKHQKNH